jgi:hypothetical protein
LLIAWMAPFMQSINVHHNVHRLSRATPPLASGAATEP